jgi:hypothetical protein
MKRASCAFVLLAVLSGGAITEAATIALNALDSGHYTEGIGHLLTNPNYIAGELSDMERRNFFLFDLSTVTLGGPIVSAALRLSTGTISTLDPLETFTIFEIVTDPITVQLGGPDPGSAIFDDLGDGTVFGARDYGLADQQMLLDIAVNGSGVMAIENALGGLLAFGGTITSLSGNPNEFVFGGTQLPFSTRQLVITTAPEPATLVLLLAAAGGFVIRRVRAG